LHKLFATDYTLIEVTPQEISLKEAVATYVFNSQLVSTPTEGGMALILPMECQRSATVNNYLQKLISMNSPIKNLHYIECRESMRNGGGPACLRLRMILTPEELLAMHEGVMLDQDLYDVLVNWVNKHYRDTLTPEDLLDPKLIDEIYVALDELSKILQLGAIYPFQH
jgi:succinylarginine dihydrolase